MEIVSCYTVFTYTMPVKPDLSEIPMTNGAKSNLQEGGSIVSKFIQQESIPVGCIPPACANHTCFNRHHHMSLPWRWWWWSLQMNNMRNTAVTQCISNGLQTPVAWEMNILNLMYYAYFYLFQLLQHRIFHTTLQHCIHHAACTFNPFDIPWILQNLLFSAYQFLAGKFP